MEGSHEQYGKILMLMGPDNWKRYKLGIIAYAESIRAHKILFGTKVEPDDPQGVPAAVIRADSFAESSGKLKLAMCMSLGSTYLHLAIGPQGDTPALLWREISKILESKTVTTLKQLMRTLLDGEQGSNNVVSFVGSVSTTKNKVDIMMKAAAAAEAEAEANAPIDVVDLLYHMVLIQGLSSKYDISKQQLFLDKSLTTTKLKEVILESTARLDAEGDDSAVEVMKASQKMVKPHSKKL